MQQWRHKWLCDVLNVVHSNCCMLPIWNARYRHQPRLCKIILQIVEKLINILFWNFEPSLRMSSRVSRCQLTSVVDASNPLVRKFDKDDMAISSEKLSITLHLPAGKSCWFESMTPSVLIHDKFRSSYSHQQPFKLQSWHASQWILTLLKATFPSLGTQRCM